MAAALVGGAFLSASLQVLFDRIASREVLDYVRGKRHYDGLLEKLETKLLSVKVVLDDAELKQMRNPAVKMWLDKLKYAADDADNLLDDIATDALERKVMEAEPITSTCNMRNIFSNFIHSKDRDRVTKMEEILDKLESMAQQKGDLGLEQGRGEKPYSSRLPSTSLIPESQVYGRDDDKDAIIKMLLSDDVGSGKIGVIPIVGMGGIGKTTLAQAVFNDNEVKELFELKAWVCVSEEFDVCKVTKTILDEIDSQPCDPKNLNSLQVRLVEKLRGKKFLIVLDDVWRENSNDWDVMSRPFQNGAQGSKIIVTTRSDNVAKSMRPTSTYSLKILSDEDCLRLFAWHALECEDFAAHSDLEKIGREIVKKCKGLPLAAKALGGVLWSTRDFLQWERIVKSEIWHLTDEKSDILPALRLSYHYLPSHLKRCFAYCSIFPKDFKFDKEELIQLWMAENLLHPQNSESFEDVGDEYFKDLLSRSFFQKSDDSSIVMHDLMVDLAAFVSGKVCVQLDRENQNDRDNPNEFVTMARHLGYSRGSHDSYEKFNCVFEASHLRTFYGVGSDYRSSYVSKEVITSLFFKLRCLRVLSFKGYRNISQLPDSMGKLRHLRYLDLSFTSIRRLPESICLLFNLQTLKLRDCRDLISLPKDMHCLINLRYLCFSGNSLLDMPIQISKLKNLQKLDTFVVGKDDGANIAELKELPNLRGALGVKNLQHVKKVEDALQAKLVDKKYLEELELEWGAKTDDDSKHQRDILEKLLPNSNLKRLKIMGYGGTTFPKWVGDRSLCTNIVGLSLANCKYCDSLPPLGQLSSLKSLEIDSFDGIVCVGAEFYGNCSSSVVKPFASLESLRFSSMPKWEVWSMPVEDADQAFPKLRQLQVHSCKMLTGDLPHFLHSLTSLHISCCEKLACSLPKMPIVSSIYLWNCKELKIDSYSFTENRSLTSLEIGDASKFVSVMDSSYESLESLSLSDLPASLKSFPLDSFPKIKSLSIRDSPNLESISVSDRLCQALTSLSYLRIWGCPNFIMFPGDGFTFPSVTRLSIGRCDRLKFLPETLHNLFPSLQDLSIDNCPEVESFSVIGLPLQHLRIIECEKLLNSNWMSWNLKTLPNLTRFEIARSGDVTSFPEEGLLPPTLTSLDIYSLSSLETLDNSGLLALTSLKGLSIGDCPKLNALPEEGLPTSLEGLSISGCPLLETLDNSGLGALTSLVYLGISNCPKLKTIPEEGLPTSLQQLSISYCPLLEKKCKRKKGKYWTKIAHIPRIEINYRAVNDI
ncbi:hypothetical protein UlMin_044958 [Ulmus minor]